MAESYAMPHWIQPPDIAAQYYRGLELGQQAASEQQRLQFQQMQSERDHMLEMQRMQITKAYQDQQIQIRQQELKQEQQKVNIATQDAARRLEGYQKFQAAVASGEDTVGAALKYLAGTGEAGGVGTLAAAFERERRMKQTPEDPYMKEFGGHKFLVVPGEYGQRPQYHPLNEDPLQRQLTMMELRQMDEDRRKLRDRISKMESDFPKLLDPDTGTDTAYMKELRSEYSNLKSDLATAESDIKNAYGNARGGGAGLAQPAPESAPATPAPMQRPWDASPATGGVGLQMPTADVSPQANQGFTIKAIRPKGSPTPSSAPAAATNSFVMPPQSQMSGVGPYGAMFGSPTNPAAQPSLSQILPPNINTKMAQQRAAMMAMLRGQIPPNPQNPYAGVDRNQPDYITNKNLVDQFVPYDQRTNLPPYLTPQMGD